MGIVRFCAPCSDVSHFLSSLPLSSSSLPPSCSDVRNFDDGEWYDMNDSRVSPSRRRSSSAAYLLFYVRQDALRECKLGK